MIQAASDSGRFYLEVDILHKNLYNSFHVSEPLLRGGAIALNK